ncbi:MAG: PD-(D/E)XK nuclease family protein [Eubacteriaceae bacterium]|nr:PD-(D/E)XK nuclease family protein [Eubacteriaceae bacterium]
MITVITGRQGSGKTTRLLEMLAKAESHSTLIVPEQYTYEAENGLLEALGSKACFDATVTSLARLASTIQSRYATGLSLVTDEARRMAMKDAVMSNAQNLQCYGPIAGTDGFCDLALALVDELTRAGSSPEDVALLGYGSDNSSYSAKFSDIALIYKAYQERLASGSADEASLMMAAGQLIAEHSIFKGEHVFFDCFFTFDAASYFLIESILSQAASATFSLLCSEPSLFEASKATLAKIKAVAAKLSIPFEEIGLGAKKAANLSMAHLEESFYSSTYLAFEQESDIKVFAAQSIQEETRYVAAQISKLVCEGMRYSDIAVACPSDDYSDVIREIFTEYGLSFFLDEKRDVSCLGPIRAVLSLLELLDVGFSTEGIIGYLKSGYCPIAARDAMRLELYCEEFGIRKGYSWEKDFSRNRDGYWNLEEINGIREMAASGIFKLRKEISAMPGAGDKCKAIFVWLMDSGFFAQIASDADRLYNEGEYELATIYAQLPEAISAAFDSLYRFFAHRQLSAGDICALLSYSFSRLKIGVIPSRSDRVNVGDLNRSRIPKAKALFCMGASEGSFPAYKSQSLLTDDERKAFGNGTLHTLDSRRLEGMLSLYATICKPSEMAFFSYSANGPLGEALSPALALNRIIALFPKCKAGYDDIEAYEYRSPNNAIKLLSEPDAPDWLLSAYPNLPVKRAAFTNASRIGNKQAFRKALGKPLFASAGLIEKYNACPFGFFAEYIIKPHIRRKPDFEPTDVGSLLHVIAKKFSEKLASGYSEGFWESSEGLSEIEKITNEAIESNEKLSYSPNKAYIAHRALRAAMLSCQAISKQLASEGYSLSLAEAFFGNGGDLRGVPAVQGQALLQGIIDRIDTAGSGYRIIDYKSRQASFDLAKAYHGLTVQLMSYSMAAEQSLGIQQANGVYYMRLMHGLEKIKKEQSAADIAKRLDSMAGLHGISVIGEGGIGSEAYKALLNRTEGVIAASLNGILDAKIDISPSVFRGQSACQYCSYKDICSYSAEFSGNKERYFASLSAKEIWSRLLEDYNATMD